MTKSRFSLLPLLATIVLLSESVIVTPSACSEQIAQQPASSTLTEAERLLEEGFELYKQGTATSYQQAIEKLERALSLWRQAGYRKGESLTLVLLGTVYEGKGEPQKALDYYNQALSLRRAIGDRKGEANTLGNIGEIYNKLGEPQKALDYFDLALSTYQSIGDRASEANTIGKIGIIYRNLGESQKALDYLERALSLQKAVGDRADEASTLNSIGLVYRNLGEPQKALDYFNQALSLRKAVGDRAGEATTLTNIGAIYRSLGEIQKAIDYYNQSLPIFKAIGFYKGETTTLNTIGLIYSTSGEMQKAIDYFNQSLSLNRQIGDRAGEAMTLNNIGIVYRDLGEAQKAIDYFNQSLPLYKAIGDREGEATILNNIGAAYNNLGEMQKALDYYNQALPIIQSVGNRSGVARTFNNIGLIYQSLGEAQKAIDYYNQSLPLYKSVSDRSGEAVTLNNMGLAYDDLGETQKALDYYNQSLPLYKSFGDRSGEALASYNIAILERDRGNLQQALEQIETAISIIEDLRTKVASPELRQSYFATVQDYYQFYIDLLMELHQQNPSQGYNAQAFDISERSRARTLLELLTEANADIRTSVDPVLLEQEQSLQQQLDAIETRRVALLSGDYTEAQKNEIERQRAKLLADYEQIKANIRSKSPKYATLTQPNPLTLVEVQQKVLDQDTVLLQYALGQEKSYLWVVTSEGMTSYELPKRSDIENTAKAFYNLLLNSQFQMATRGKSDTRGIDVTPTGDNLEPAINLSQMLLGQVGDKLNKKRIVVVADGALQYIPFAALPLPGSQINNLVPLVSQYEVVNLPSSSTVAVIREQTANRQVAPEQIAIFADPVFGLDDERVANKLNKSADNNELNRLALSRAGADIDVGVWQRLPGTRQEAEAIIALVSEAKRLQEFDFDANLTNATNPQLSNYQIVHFATHGILNSTSPELSGLVLSLVDRNGQSINGFLRLNDIFNLNLPAELVVLSACETGLGKDISGEGMIGMTRGFMYAGAKTMVVSLWQVDDAATKEMMSRFYRLMLEGKQTPAEALRSAQLEMQQQTQWKSPYYWSGFVLQGEWR